MSRHTHNIFTAIVLACTIVLAGCADRMADLPPHEILSQIATCDDLGLVWEYRYSQWDGRVLNVRCIPPAPPITEHVGPKLHH